MNASASVYPRDLRGHGANPPHARWPGGARIAVQFVLNYEEGGENNVLHGDAVSETFLSELVTAQAYENRHMTMESMYEYGSRAGVEQVEHGEEREAGHPGRVALPHRPVQLLGQARRRHRVLLLVIEAAAVDRPQLAADALGAILLVGRRRQARVEADEVERGADPGDAGDDVRPAQQHVGPVEQVRIHRACGDGERMLSCRDRSSTTTD